MKTRIALGLLALIGFVTPQSVRALDTEPNVGAFQPLPKSAEIPTRKVTPELIALGKKLYLDPSLSESKKISCNSCHDLKKYGVDNEPTSPGHEGKRGERNSPTVYNAALHVAQFWDGRAADVEAQALGPVMNPIEMAMPKEEVVLERLHASEEYKKMFGAAFPGAKDPVSFINMGIAIGAFERTLLTPSRFDLYLEGKKDALTPAEKKGLQTFVTTGCIACHNGATIGGQMFQKLGLLKPYPTKDLGRYNVTKSEADKYFFKVPSLRNIEKTAPYFHDGSVKTLEEAVKLMADHQLARQLTDTEVAEIVTFLKSLTGTIPKSAL